MARMPTRDDLPQAVPTADKSIVRYNAPDIGAAVSSLGVSLARQGKADKDKQSSLELARARSFMQTSLLQGRDAYNLENKPEYQKWEGDAAKGARSWQQIAMEHITDPEVRERFRLETEDDVARFGIGIGDKATEIGNREQKATAQMAIDEMARNAADPNLTNAERADYRRDIIETYKGLVKTGVMTSQEAALATMKLRQKISGLQVLHDIQNDPVGAHNAMAGSDSSAVNLIKEFEGYISVPKWDVNAQRGGYGSDTITTADGKVVKVKKGMRISRADAERDIVRRTAEFQDVIRGQVSGKTFNVLPENVQAALTSIAYNYGSLPKRIVPAVKSGDPARIAKAVEGLAGDNDGINARRRFREAAIIRGDEEVSDKSYYKDLSAEDKLKLQKQAQTASDAWLEEQEKNDAIEASQELVDYALENFEDDPEGAYQYIQDTALDPEIRQDAEKALDVEYRRKAAIEEQQYVEKYDAADNAVQQAIDAGDLAAARKAIPADLKAEDRRRLEKLVDEGPAKNDNQEVYGELHDLYMDDPAKFAEVNLSQYRGELSSGTIDKLHGWQQKIGKKDKFTHTTVGTAKAMIDTELNIMGIKTTGNRTEVDHRYAQRVRSMVATEMNRLEDIKGRALTSEEIQGVIDDTFVTYRAEVPGTLWGTNEVNRTMKDVWKSFNEYEESQKMVPGTLIDKAIRDWRAKFPDRGNPTPEQLDKLLYNIKNQRQLSR